jgi:hypothetical protein
MEKFKKIIWLAIFIIVMLPLTMVKANEKLYVSAGTVASLNKQLYLELKDVMSLPVNLLYQDREIKGTAYVLIKVDRNGKLEIVNLLADNENLKKIIEGKINSRNMWTDTRYANILFRFKIEMI